MMKKGLLAISLVVGLSSFANAGIPVSVIGDATATMNQIQTIAQWAKQLEEMKNQYDEMKRQYKAVTGSRGMGNIFNNPELRNYLPDDWKKTFDEMQRLGASGMSAGGKQLYDQSKIYDRCKSSKDAKMIALCEASSGHAAENLSNLTSAFDKAQSRIEQIQQLMSTINSTSDPKAIAELQARTQAENAMIQNEQSKIAMYSMISNAREQMRTEQMKQMNLKNASKKGGVRVTNVNF